MNNNNNNIDSRYAGAMYMNNPTPIGTALYGARIMTTDKTFVKMCKKLFGGNNKED